MAFRSLAICCYLLLLLGGPAARAQTLDPHQLYEQRCGRCHAPHAGDFVPDALERRGDRIVGRRSGRELRAFLAGGHGRLAAPEVEVVAAHLAAILEAGGLFRDKCLICHRQAVSLARSHLVLRDGRVMGRYTHRDIAAFLENHGRLEAGEIPTVVRMLARQLAPRKAE